MKLNLPKKVWIGDITVREGFQFENISLKEFGNNEFIMKVRSDVIGSVKLS